MQNCQKVVNKCKINFTSVLELLPFTAENLHAGVVEALLLTLLLCCCVVRTLVLAKIAFL